MIDEKKIEEAAEKYAIFDAAGFQLENRGEEYYYQYNVEEAFKTGINWFLDNLWHDASEEPKENSTVVLVAKFDNEPYTAFYSHSFKAFNGEGVFQIKDAAHYDDCYFFSKDIDKWFYFDDLLKGGK